MNANEAVGTKRGAIFKVHPNHVGKDTDVTDWILQTKGWLHGRRDRCARHMRTKRREAKANEDVVARFESLRNIVKAAAYRCHVSGRGLTKIAKKIDPEFVGQTLDLETFFQVMR